MNPSEAAAGVGHLHSHALRQPAEPDADRLLGPDAGVAHRIGHKFGHEEKDIGTDGGGQRAVAREHGLPGRNASLRPAAHLEDKPLPGASAVDGGDGIGPGEPIEGGLKARPVCYQAISLTDAQAADPRRHRG
jgi:hypothetical protein